MAVRGFSDLTSSHPWQEKREDSEAAAAEKVEEPKHLCSHCFFGCKSFIWDRFLMAVRALLNSFFEGTVRGFSDLTSSHPWQEKRKDSEAAAAEKAEELKDLCSLFFLAVRALFFLGGGGCKSLIAMAVRALCSHFFFGCKSLIFFFLGGGGWL